MKPRDGPDPKIGAGHLAGMGRQGLNEIRGVLYPDSNIAKPPDLGIFGNATPGEIGQSRQAASDDIDRWEQEGGSLIQKHIEKAQAARDVLERDDKNLERE